MTIHNRTPHPITILAADAPADSPPALELPAAGRGQIARVETTAHTVGTINVLATSPLSRASERTLPDVPTLYRDVVQIDVVSQRWGRVVGLAAPSDGEPQVVSAIVAAAMQAQGLTLHDIYVPADQVRDDKGRIVGCRGLLRAEDAVPRLGSPPQVVVFGSVLRSPREARDIDVGYCGMDPRTAARIVAERIHEWSPELRHLELDLRCLPQGDVVHPEIGRLRVLEVPRPAALPGEDITAFPLDSDRRIIFGTPACVWQEHRNIPARLRRAERLLELGCPEEQVIPMLVAGLAEPHVLVMCEEPPSGADLMGCGYDAPTLSTVRRGVARLEARLPEALRRVGEYAEKHAVPGPWRTLATLQHASEEQRRHFAATVCPPSAASGSAPAWQRRAGRLRTHAGLIGSDYGAEWISDEVASALLLRV